MEYIARSAGLGCLMRWAASLVILAGVALISWGMFGEVQRYTTAMAMLVDPGSLEAASELAPPAQTPTAAEDAGFIPIQIEPGALSTHAPAIPVTGSTPEPPAQAVDPAVPPPPTPTLAPTVQPGPPERISIPSINLDALVVIAPRLTVTVDGKTFDQWDAPNGFASGWQEGSAMLGQPGNTVLNGHHNIKGEVFGRLRELKRGDEIIVYSGSRPFHYVVSQVMKLKERDVPLAQREDNARWILPSDDERLTLVTCWPPTSNTYRLIVVAVPVR